MCLESEHVGISKFTQNLLHTFGTSSSSALLWPLPAPARSGTSEDDPSRVDELKDWWLKFDGLMGWGTWWSKINGVLGVQTPGALGVQTRVLIADENERGS